MKFKRLYVKNFLSVGEIPLEIDFSNYSGIVLIKGNNLDVSTNSSNASGKSTIIEAVIFALTGEVLRKISKDEHLINNNAKTDCVVELEVDNIKIVRKFILNKKGKKKESQVELYVDGKLVSTDASVNKAKEDIYNYLNINFQTLCNILIFGQHNMISFLEASEPDRKEIIENLMNVKEYNLFEEKARTLLKDNKNNQKSAFANFQIFEKNLKDQEEIVLSHKKKQKDYLDQINSDISSIKNKINSFPSFEQIEKDWQVYQEREVESKNLQDKLNALISSHSTATAELSYIVSEKNKELSKREDILDEKKTFQKEKDELYPKLDFAKEKKIKPIEDEIKQKEQLAIDLENNRNKELIELVRPDDYSSLLLSLSKQKDKIENNIDSAKNKKIVEGSICQECFSPINSHNCSSYIANQEKELLPVIAEIDKTKQIKETSLNEYNAKKEFITKSYREKLDKVKDEINTLFTNKTDTQNYIKERFQLALAKIDNNLLDIDKKVKEFDENVNNKYKEKISLKEQAILQLNTDISNIKSKILEIKKLLVTPKFSMEEINNLKVELQSLNTSLSEKNKQLGLNPFDDIISASELKYKEISKSFEDSKSSLQEIEKTIPYYEYMLFLFGKEGIKKFVVNHIIPTLNQQIAYWMNIIYDSNIELQFDSLLVPSIKNNSSNNPIILGQGSGGECVRMDLAIMLAFRQVMKISSSTDPNIIFFDEVVEYIDSPGVEGIYNALEDLSKTNTVFVITHNKYLLDLLEKNSTKLVVTKKNGFSQLM